MAQRADGKAGRAELRAVIEPIVTSAGFDLEDVEVARAGRRYVVRVVVDGDGGVDHDELGEVSHQVSAALDATEAAGSGPAMAYLAEPYTLEVSSPGVQRPLTLPRHWRRNVGRLVRVRVAEQTLTARVVATDATSVTLAANGAQTTVPYPRLGPGRVQVEFDRVAADEAGETSEASEAGEASETSEASETVMGADEIVRTGVVVETVKPRKTQHPHPARPETHDEPRPNTRHRGRHHDRHVTSHPGDALANRTGPRREGEDGA